jgi:16S rRNA (guanine527-N7)-methyltransferase
MMNYRDNPLLARYVRELWEWNKKFSLTGAKDTETIWNDHIPDSLYLEEFIRNDPRGMVVDIGSGQGLPVVPLAVAVPGKRYIATEVNERKIGFLDWMAASLSLPVETVKILPKTHIGGACMITAKAFAQISDIVNWQKKHAPDAEVFYLLKGNEDNVKEELSRTAKRFPDMKDAAEKAVIDKFEKGCVVVIHIGGAE